MEAPRLQFVADQEFKHEFDQINANSGRKYNSMNLESLANPFTSLYKSNRNTEILVSKDS